MQPINLDAQKNAAMEKALKTLTRRGFIAATAGAGALLGQTSSRRLSQRTLFFNLSHENVANTSHFIVANGRTYNLTRVIHNPVVLAAARRVNRFLNLVPDQHITHHVEGVLLSSEISNLVYVGSNVNTGTGTWSMSMIVQYLPGEAIGQAYARARARNGSVGPLPLSAKRAFYGHPPAMTELDLQEEQDLVDSTDHARTLIGLHPDLLCAEPNGASHIHTTHIVTNAKTRFLAGILRSKGAADPQQTPGQPNSRGWATLIPLSQDNGQPFKTSTGLNQYFPDWDSTVDEQVGGAVNEIHRQVKDDVTLGADVTNLSTSNPPDLSGKVWYRHDGVSHVTRTPAGLQADPTLQWNFQQKNGETGLDVGEPSVTSQSGSVTITLDNVNNWFLRFLGVWLQFVDPNGNVISTSQLSSNTIPSRGGPSPFDKSDTLFAGILPPAFSVAGIPVAPGNFSITVNVPPDAETIRVYYSGAGLSGSDIAPSNIWIVGGVLTFGVNFGLVAFFMGVGVSGIGPVMKLITTAVGQILAQEMLAAIGAELDGGISKVNFTSVGLAFVKGLLNGLAGKGLTTLITAITAQVVTAEAIDSIPIVGQIARAVAAVIGAVQLAETAIEVGVSPPTYQFDLVLTHDVTVTILPDVNNNQFPQLPSGYTLYYKISYLLDNGSAHVMDAVEVPDPTVKSIQVTLHNLPRGGRLNVIIGFYARTNSTPAGQNDWCAGNGSTGLVDNTIDVPLTITIKQNKIPITASTQYIHTRKLTLDAAGRHVWTNSAAAPPYIPPSGGQTPGSLGALRNITVRQGTRSQQGYLGYAWQAYSRTLNDCIAGSPGQLDQAANLNTDAGNNGTNAQNGYVTTSCGLQGGATSGLKLTYSLLTDDTANFYLDTSSLLVRQIQLNPPEFANPTQGQSVGKLNLDSTRLLLHPAGHLVSINNANHKLEALKLPGAPMSDADAQTKYLARTYAGQGTRPGLMISPAAAVISQEGAILVLEDSAGNNRIQAFDLGGNPIPFFKGQNIPYFLQLTATQNATYLDLAVEFTGYLYVLSQEASSGVFRLDIYHPTQTGTNPICTTRGVNAAKLAVDFWRSVYTLNYEVMQLPGGTFPDITEPSVSLWVPSIPS